MGEPASSHAYRLAANVAHETFEDEHIVVNLESGRYYAMRGEAADVWVLAMAGLDAVAIGAEMSRAWTGPADRIAAEVAAFLARLVEESLLAPVAVPGPPAATALPPRGRAFGALAFEVHEDLQDLLLLDPIHEVDEAGWPVMRPDQSDDRS